jgi:predicted GNAT superfamily acetyltransferase
MRAAVTTTVVRPLESMDEMTRASELFAAIWGYPPGESPVTPELLRALAHSGNYVSGAWLDDELIGASAGFIGRHGDTVHLHSHISGVLPAHQGTRAGFALKQHQRDWALERDIPVIEWTFDPLVRRNAYFNLAKLGATVVGYEPDFYGAMRDAINAGEETDRAVAKWDLVNARSTEAKGADAAVVLFDEGGQPSADGDAIGDAAALRAWIPEDNLALRARDPELSRAWRLALRDTVGRALDEGYIAVDMTRDGWYTLIKERQ